MKKKLLAITLIATMVLAVAACGSKKNNEANNDSNNEQVADTIASRVLADFKKAVADGKKTTNDIANALNEAGHIELGVDIVDAPEGATNFNGLSDVKSYKNCTEILPFIGAQPFAAYVFEADDTAALVKELEANVDLRWNICTAADEYQVAVQGNFVCIVLAPYNFED